VDVPPILKRHDPAEQRHDGEHHEEDDDEQPLQGARADGHAHLVAQRPQDVVAAEHAEEVGERPEHGGKLAGLDGDEARDVARGGRVRAGRWGGHGDPGWYRRIVTGRPHRKGRRWSIQAVSAVRLALDLGVI
jgi:hypothetical protein